MSATAATVAQVATCARIVDFETKEVEINIETPGEALTQLRQRRYALPLEYLGFSLEERRAVAAWMLEQSETEALVQCIQGRIASGVFDGEEERRARIETALQNNLRRLEELTVLLQTTKLRIVDAWRRCQMEDTLRERERMLPAPVVICG